MLQRGFTPEGVSRALRPAPPEKTPPEQTPAPRIDWTLGVQLIRFGAQVGLSYYRNQEYWRQREQRVLARARDHEGWLTEALFLEAVEFKSREVALVSERLCKQGLCRIVVGRYGLNVYLFESLMPQQLVCDYCDQPRPNGQAVTCNCCGAP